MYWCVCWGGGKCRRELLFHREVTGVFQVLIDTIMLFIRIKITWSWISKIKHKTLAQNPVQNKKNAFGKMFSKNLIHSQKALLGACMQILNLTFQHHTTAKDKNLYMCYKNSILGEKEQHSIITQLQTVSVRWFN